MPIKNQWCSYPKPLPCRRRSPERRGGPCNTIHDDTQTEWVHHVMNELKKSPMHTHGARGSKVSCPAGVDQARVLLFPSTNNSGRSWQEHFISLSPLSRSSELHACGTYTNNVNKINVHLYFPQSCCCLIKNCPALFSLCCWPRTALRFFCSYPVATSVRSQSTSSFSISLPNGTSVKHLGGLANKQPPFSQLYRSPSLLDNTCHVVQKRRYNCGQVNVATVINHSGYRAPPFRNVSSTSPYVRQIHPLYLVNPSRKHTIEHK